MNLSYKILILFLVLNTSTIQGQNDVVTLKNGNEHIGIIELVEKKIISFLDSKDSKRIEFKFEEVEKFKQIKRDTKKEFAFVRIKENSPSEIMELLYEGSKANLYLKAETGNNPGLGSNTGAIGGHYATVDYYVKKKSNKLQHSSIQFNHFW